MRQRDKLRKCYYKAGNPFDWEQYRTMRIRRRAVLEHFKKLCKEKFANQSTFWSTIRPYIHSRKQKNNNRIILKERGGGITQ